MMERSSGLAILNCFISVLFLTSSSLTKQIFIDYGVSGEGHQLLKFFMDKNDGFYVDIGAYDSIYASNTLNLYTQGWGGINIDANPSRLSRFFIMRPDQTNLNYAVGQNQKIVTLYQLSQDSSSTVSEKVKQFVKQSKVVLQQIKIPSISLRQICERYYYRKPIFMNLDIQGYGAQALLNNNWNNPLCVPEVIFSQINQETKQSGLQLPESILKRYGYTLLPQRIGLNQVYVHNNYTSYYQQKAQKAKSQIQSLDVQHILTIMGAVTKHKSLPTILFKHHQPQKDNYYYKFAKNQQTISLNKLNKQSNQWILQNRPLIILHFNPSRNTLILQEGEQKSAIIKIGTFEFLQINVTKVDNRSYTVLILNHRQSSDFNISILKPKLKSTQLNSNKTFTSPVPRPQNPYAPYQQPPTSANPEQQQITNSINKFTQQIKNNRQILNTISSKYEKQNQLLKSNFITYHNLQVSLLSKMSEKYQTQQNKMNEQLGNLSIINKKVKEQISKNIQQKQKIDKGLLKIDTNRTIPAKIQKSLSSIDNQIQNLATLLKFSLILVGIMAIILCTSVSIITRKTKSKIIKFQQQITETNMNTINSPSNSSTIVLNYQDQDQPVNNKRQRNRLQQEKQRRRQIQQQQLYIKSQSHRQRQVQEQRQRQRNSRNKKQIENSSISYKNGKVNQAKVEQQRRRQKEQLIENQRILQMQRVQKAREQYLKQKRDLMNKLKLEEQENEEQYEQVGNYEQQDQEEQEQYDEQLQQEQQSAQDDQREVQVKSKKSLK